MAERRAFRLRYAAARLHPQKPQRSDLITQRSKPRDTATLERSHINRQRHLRGQLIPGLGLRRFVLAGLDLDYVRAVRRRLPELRHPTGLGRLGRLGRRLLELLGGVLISCSWFIAFIDIANESSY